MDRRPDLMKTRKEMFPKDINKELTNVLNERNKKKGFSNKSHSGHTSQEEDDEITTTKCKRLTFISNKLSTFLA
jgi:hypothetical protein